MTTFIQKQKAEKQATIFFVVGLVILALGVVAVFVFKNVDTVM